METVIRVLIIYLVVLVGLRILGKREFGQLSPLELVSLLLVPELVSSAVQLDDFSIVDATVAVATLFTLVFLTSVVMHLSDTAQKVIEDEPAVLAHHGQFIPHVMNRERVSPEEIYGEMHKSGLHRIEQVRWAILETDGSITLIPENEGEREKRGKHPQDTAGPV